MPILTNTATLATCRQEGGQGDVHEIENGVLAWTEDEIRWVGKEADLPERYADEGRVDAGGRLVIPGLVDCHTHLAFGGWRADEFEMRCLGKSYLEIARAGGGIASTVKHTREASEEELLDRCHGFLREMAALGVTTVECKSGYGLTVEDELKQLRIYRRLREEQPIGIVPTFLGAHIVPPEFEEKREDYIALLTEELIPRIAEEGLADFCDVFVEETAYSIEEAREILQAGKEHGLRPKLHADQLSDGGGAALAAELKAISADHLEQTSEDGIRALSEAGVVAVNLPLASLYLKQPPMQTRRFIEAGVPVAVATDFNPGSAPSHHLPLAMMLACTMSSMTPKEALKGATLYAARAIGQGHRIGSLEPGKQANFALIDAPSINHWLYHFRGRDAAATFVKGRRIHPA